MLIFNLKKFMGTVQNANFAIFCLETRKTIFVEISILTFFIEFILPFILTSQQQMDPYINAITKYKIFKNFCNSKMCYIRLLIL